MEGLEVEGSAVVRGWVAAGSGLVAAVETGLVAAVETGSVAAVRDLVV